HTLQAQAASSPIWMQLLITALLLLPLDIAVRRLVVTRRDLVRLWDAVFGVASAATAETSERMSSLMSARERAREQIETGVSPSRTVSELRRNRAAGDESAVEPEAPKPVSIGDEKTSFAALRQRRQVARGEKPTPAAPKPESKTPPASTPKPAPKSFDDSGSGNIGSRLLKRRRTDDEK
ncbi:MAG: hypothetical protein AAF653_20670, partial [Chloroflexota bacterium]